ncbi:MerR family transcriptional regulator [Streptomyces sp. NPDC058145]|uniref:MerR family transcriptional regulator n=1 Tax=Streptomyces sp. NPDC058145 TaxID=3346356 RepID=UPI0036E45C97
MDGDTLYSIGELARRTGLTVKTIRFYSDRGIVTPTDRSPAGYRRYNLDAVARLDLVRTLRELGLDLPTIHKVVDRELPLPEVAAAHAEALAVQIRVLRLRHAVLTAVAERRLTPEETDLMHRFAQLSEDERRCLIGDFLDAVFDGLGADSAFTGVMRSMTPELPDHPEAEQTLAWMEWAELVQPGHAPPVCSRCARFAPCPTRCRRPHARRHGGHRQRHSVTRTRPRRIPAATRRHTPPVGKRGPGPSRPRRRHRPRTA